MNIQEIQPGAVYQTTSGFGRVISVDQQQGEILLIDSDHDCCLKLSADDILARADAQYHCKDDLYY